MNLDDLNRFRELDSLGMSHHIDALPDQLEALWAAAGSLPIPQSIQDASGQFEQIVISAQGTAALAAEILMTAYAGVCKLPITLHIDSQALSQAYNPRTLVLALGNTPENLVTAPHILTVSADDLDRIMPNADIPSRAQLGSYVGLLLSVLHQLDCIPSPEQDIQSAIQIMRGRIPIMGIESPVVKNPAKRLAGQMIGRIPVIIGGGIMAPVARRWKMQLNENGKTWAQSEALSDVIHYAASGTLFPAPLMTRVNCVFLVPAPFEPPLLAHQANLAHDLYMQQGIAVDKVKGRGDTPLSQALSTIQYGDYVSFYVAMAYGIDPSLTPATDELTEKLAAATLVSSSPQSASSNL